MFEAFFYEKIKFSDYANVYLTNWVPWDATLNIRYPVQF